MDAEDETRLFRQADRVALDLEVLGHDPELRNPDARAASLRRATLLAGVLWEASEILIDMLTDDLVEVHRGDTPEEWQEAVRQSGVMADLPQRFHHLITPVVVRRFLVVAVDLTSRISQGWEPPACVAQELMLRELLGQVEVVIDTYAVDVEEHWRSSLEDQLFEDLDHEYLFDPAHDGFENDPAGGPPGMARMDFASWFVPFGPQYRMPPYAEDESAPPRLD